MSKKVKLDIDAKLEDLKDHRQKSYEHLFYSAQRFDLLTIAISSFAILQGIGLLKFIIEKKKVVDLTILWVALAFFILTIIFNFISQLVTYQLNKNEFYYTDQKIMKIQYHENYSKEKEDNYGRLADGYDRINNYLNIGSLVGLILGIITMGIFVFRLRILI